jgi:RimK family alpha-L-glutamate ligase
MVSKIGVPVPDSSLTISPESSMSINKKMGFPIVLKLLRGFGGKGVMLINSEEELRPVLDTLNVLDELLSAQKFIPNLQTDIRALIIGEKIIGIRRKGTGSEWRANVSTGGNAEIIELNENLKGIARSVAKMLRLDICAVDFIETENGSMFIEANFTPGIMAKYFDTKLADMMLSFIKKTAERKKIDKD